MSSYIAKDTLHPRVFILACNVDALVVQSTQSESKIVLLNQQAASNDSIYPQVAISACNESLYFYKNSNVLAYYNEINGRPSHVVDRTIANQYLFQNSSDTGIGYSNETILFQHPFTSIPILSATYNTEARIGIGITVPTQALHVQGNILASGTVITSNLVVLGDSVILDTITSNTEQMVITNLGTGPALKVTQTGPQPVAEFYDDDTLTLVVADGGLVGIRTDLPQATLDIYGTLQVSSNTVVLGNLGIGTTIPRDTVDIVGGFQLQGPFYQNGTEVVFTNLIDGWQFNPSNSNVYYLNGNVGIGTSSASQKLQILGNVDVQGNVFITSNITTPYLKGTASNIGYKLSTNGYLLGESYDGSQPLTWTLQANSNNLPNTLVARDNQSSIFVNQIGIGTTLLQSTADIQGNLFVSGTIGIGTVSSTRFSITPNLYEPKLTLWHSNEEYIGLGVSSNQFNYHTNKDHVFYVQGSNGDGMEILRIQYGNVGIGTSLPQQTLDIQGSVYISQSLGIGTTLPKQGLDIYGPIYTNHCNIYLESGSLYASNIIGTVTQVGQSISTSGYLLGESFNGSMARTWSIYAYSNNEPNALVARDAQSNIYVSGVGIGTTQLRHSIDTSGSIILQGNLGIGTTLPIANIHINTAIPTIQLDGTNGNLINIQDTSYLRFGSDQSYKTHVLVVGDSFTSAPGRINLRYKNYIGFDVVNGISGSGTEKVRLDSQGNVGIGTQTPQEKLDIVGKLQLSDTFISTLSTGTPPFSIQSTSLVSNLNVELLSGENKGYYRNINNINDGTLPIIYGGTGCNVFPSSKLVIGNGTQPLLAPWELHWDGSRLGIATDQPRQRLDVIGSVIVSSNVGIGTTLPRAGLDIVGNLQISEPIVSTLTTGTSPFTITSTTLVNNLNVQYLDGQDGNFYRDLDNMTTGTLVVPRGGTGCNLLPTYKLLVGNGGDPVTTPWELHWQHGNLGIGTHLPQSTLDVQGSIQTSQTLISTISTGIPPIQVQSTSLVSNLNVQYLNGQDGNYYTNVNNIQSGILNVQYGGTSSNYLSYNKLLVGQGTQGVLSPSELDWNQGRFSVTGTIYASSNLGINTLNPQSELDVQGKITTQTLGIGTYTYFNSYGNLGIGTQITPYPFQVYSTDSVLTVNQGKLGIFKVAQAASTDLEIQNSSTDYTGILLKNSGNVQPGASLQIVNTRFDQASNLSYAAHLGLQRYNNNSYLTSNIPLGFIHFGGNHTSGSTTNRVYTASIGGITEEEFINDSHVKTALIFQTGHQGYQYKDASVYLHETMRLNADGNLGIGTSQPKYTLDVQGSFQSGKGLQGSSTTYQGGPYHRQRSWDNSNQTHLISYPDYCMSKNSCGTLHIQIKSLSYPFKLGNVSASFLVPDSGEIDLFNVFYHQNEALTTLSVQVSSSNLLITTDPECAIAWTTIGAC